MSLARFVRQKLSEESVTALVEQELHELTGVEGLEEIILFGSAARGEMTDGSDLDFVLIFIDELSARKASKILRVARPPRKTPCDFICVDRKVFSEKALQGGVLMVAHEDGKTIYRKGDSLGPP